MLHGKTDIAVTSLTPHANAEDGICSQGFADSASKFRVKSRRIARRIHELVAPQVLDEFPGGIEFVYLDAPFSLKTYLQFREETDSEDEMGGTQTGDCDSTHLGWWQARDNTSKYYSVEASLSFVAKAIHGRPIHAIIGFSQGACLAGMICSLLESHNNPEKIAAIRWQNLPVNDYLRLPGQQQLRFFVGLGGYQGTLEYYGSLYGWLIETPSCHTMASFDAVVENNLTTDLAHCFMLHEFVPYYGSHFVPRDRRSVESIAQFASRNCSRWAFKEQLIK